MSSSKTYGFAIKNLADRYNNVNVTEQKAALKFLYDVDIACPNKQDAFAIFKTRLHVLTNMPGVLRECDGNMEEMQESHKKEKWEVFAERKRDIERGSLKARVELLQQSIAKKQIDIQELSALAKAYPDGRLKLETEFKLSETKIALNANKTSLRIHSAAYNRLMEKPKWTPTQKAEAEAEAGAVSDRSAQAPSWEQVMEKILIKVLKVEEAGGEDSESDDDDDKAEAITALKRVCMSRLRDCVLTAEKGALGLATELKEEVAIQAWGLKILQMAPKKIKKEDRVMNWEAQNRFLQCGDMSGYHIPVKSESKAEKCMDDIIELLRNHANSYGAQAHDMNVVAAVARGGQKGGKAKVTRIDSRSGNWEEKHVVQEPCDDEEEDTPVPVQKKAKVKQSKAELAEQPVVAAVRPMEGKMLVHPDRAARDITSLSEIDRLRAEYDQKLERLKREQEDALVRATRGRERERSPRQQQRRERFIRPRFNDRESDRSNDRGNDRYSNSNNDRNNNSNNDRNNNSNNDRNGNNNNSRIATVGTTTTTQQQQQVATATTTTTVNNNNQQQQQQQQQQQSRTQSQQRGRSERWRTTETARTVPYPPALPCA